MRIVILGGAGIIGRGIAADLAGSGEQVYIADLDPQAARAAAEATGAASEPGSLDVRDRPALLRVLQGASVCVNSVNYYFNLEVMQACLELGVPYLDLGGLFHMTRRQLELHKQFEARQLTALLGIGSCPGVANVQAGWLATMLDELDSLRIYNGSSPVQEDPLAAPYALETILDEISLPAMVFRDGAFQERPALSEEEAFFFPPPIGWAKTHLSLHSEVATIPLSFAAKGIRECSFKISFFGFSEAAVRKLQFLAQLGLSGRDPVPVDGKQVVPRRLLLELLARIPKGERAPAGGGFKAVVTEASGKASGRLTTLRAETTGGPGRAEAAATGPRLVAGPAAIAARWLGSGRLQRPGVWAPEQAIEPEAFFAELARRGFETRLVRSETVAAPEQDAGSPSR